MIALKTMIGFFILLNLFLAVHVLIALFNYSYRNTKRKPLLDFLLPDKYESIEILIITVVCINLGAIFIYASYLTGSLL